MKAKTPLLPDSLSNVTRRKQEVLADIRRQRSVVQRLGEELMQPLAPPSSRLEGMMRLLNRVATAYDGVMTGWKLVRSFRSKG
ncbi:MAG: hypothetical protein IJ511_00360 [Bacteroides sp.]|nr:hypothetical protein [Bacteroides sp.]